jgi:Na+-driven multidrug efflux pump
MLRLALPVLVEQFLVMLVGFSDTILTGHYLAQPHLAAITLISYLLWLAYGLFSVVAIGATALIARFVGAGRHRLARRVANQALLVGAAVAAVAMLTGFWLADRAVLALQLEGEAAVLATRFVHYILLALPMVMLEAVGIACLRGAGDMISGLGVMALLFTMIGFLGVRLPAAYWLAFPSLQLPGTHLVLAGWGLGVLGAWYAMVSDLGVRVSLVLYRFWQGGWTRVEV